MLYLRRFPSQRFAVFDARGEIWIKVTGIDAPNDCVTLEARIGPGPKDKLLWTKELFADEHMNLMQGYVDLMLKRVTPMNPPPDECTIGIKAPFDILIKNEEFLRGTDRAYRIRMQE